MTTLRRTRYHARRAARLIPWGAQTRAKRPHLLRQVYGPEMPLYFKKARGPFLWGLDGNRYTAHSTLRMKPPKRQQRDD